MRIARGMMGAMALVIATAACVEEERTTDQATVQTEAETTEATASADVLLNPNEASREELLAAGLDTVQVDALIAGRPWANMNAVDAVLRLEESERDSVYGRVWLPIDLNTASGEEILLIPGVGERMRHEFEEYRPYRGIEQFRREIGKYVDEAEVARLERYVTIR
ncbi:MAG TPA: hypothetical protein VMN78_12540 [Longimicrobiales bacterium]|nr:hypothetical protein [Longimicrobiales bacterium]